MNPSYNQTPTRARTWTGPCVGIDIDGGQRYAVRVKGNLFGLSAERIAWEDPALQSSIRAGRTAVAAAMPQSGGILRWIDTPLANIGKARRVLPSLLDIQLPFKLEECACVFPRVERKPDGHVRGLAVIARAVDIVQRLEELRARDADPFFLDHESLALWVQALAEWPPRPAAAGAQPVRAIIYLGTERNLIVFGRGADFISAHSLHGLRADQVGRLLRTLGVESGGRDGVEWLWVGPAAAHQEIIASFLHAIGNTETGSSRVAADPELFLPRALAIRARGGSPLPCNLRGGEMAHPLLARKQRRRATAAALTCLAAGLLLIAAHIAWRNGLDRIHTGLQAEVQAEASAILGRKAQKGAEILEVQRHLTGLAGEAAPFLRPGDQQVLLALERLLLNAGENAITLGRVALNPPAVLEIQGAAPGWEAVEQFGRGLKAAGYTGKLERRESASQGKVAFSFQAGGKP